MGNRQTLPVTYESQITSALEHTDELADPQDRCNAHAVLSVLRAHSSQPRGYTEVPILARFAVLEYMRNHAVLVHHEHADPNSATLRRATVVV